MISIVSLLIEESETGVFYHGSTDRSFLGKNGIHVGTKRAATQALQARIGVPAEGEWDGTRKYGDTLLAGKKTLLRREKELGYYVTTGFNVGSDVPEEDYFARDREAKAKYSDGTTIDPNSKPTVFRVRIKGPMKNSRSNPKTDTAANSLMRRQLKLGNARTGFYYTNDGEDSGSLSAVVPNGQWLEAI